MEHALPFAAWEGFYVIVGSSAAALTGLQFVVIALGAESRAIKSPEVILAFASPTVVHFSVTLLISGILTAPWETVPAAGVILTLAGAVGVAYTTIVLRRFRKLSTYKPELEDWLWHLALPLAAYVTLLLSAVTLPQSPTGALFVIGATALLLLLTGIHNAWDAVTYIAIEQRKESGG